MSDDLRALSANLRRLRATREMSQDAVAQAARLSRVGYRKIEAGEVVPRPDSLARIAAALRVRLADLVAEARHVEHVRFRANKKMALRQTILADVARWMDDYAFVETAVDQAKPWTPAPEATRAQPKKAAALVRQQLGLDDGRSEAIRDIAGLLEDNGIKLYAPSIASGDFFGLSIGAEDGGPAIVVNCWERITVERWIFTAAHELGHLVLHHGAYRVDETEEDSDEEHAADVFASQFLMPPALFEKELKEAAGLPTAQIILKLKLMFKVSWRTVVYRLAERHEQHGGKSADVWRHCQVELKRHYGRALGRTDEPHALTAAHFSMRPATKARGEGDGLSSSVFTQDRLHRLVRLAVRQQKISLSRGAEILRLELPGMRALARDWSVVDT